MQDNKKTKMIIVTDKGKGDDKTFESLKEIEKELCEDMVDNLEKEVK